MNIIMILLGRRMESAVQVQSILSDFSDVIKIRLGMNRDLSKDSEASGFIFMEVDGEEERMQDLCRTLNEIADVKAECMDIQLASE